MTPDTTAGEDPNKIGNLYDEQAEAFSRAPGFFWWKAIGQDIYCRYVLQNARKGTRVLDLGAGSGRVIDFLTRGGIAPSNITGIELSHKQVKMARKLIPDATIEQGDISKIKILSGPYDVAHMCMVAEFLDNHQLNETLINTHGALKPGGSLLIVTTHPELVKRRSGVERGKYEATFPWGEKGPNYARPKEDFVEALEGAGYEIDKIEELGVSPNMRHIDPTEYDRYENYHCPIRLVIMAKKPDATTITTR